MKNLSLIIAGAAIIGLAGPAWANCTATNALIAAEPDAFVYSKDGGTDRMAHESAPLRFQCGGGYTGIAIPGGSDANFDESALRQSGDPTYGAVVEFDEPS